MKSQILLIAGLLLVPCFAVDARVQAAKADEQVIAEGCECLPMHTPMLEKVSSQCSVEEKAPAQCFRVEKVHKTTDVYKIPSHCKRCCTITDENGSRPCNCGETLSCGCKKECTCQKPAAKCEKPAAKCEKCHEHRCHTCPK